MDFENQKIRQVSTTVRFEDSPAKHFPIKYTHQTQHPQ